MKKRETELNSDDKVMLKKIEILTRAVDKVYPGTKLLMWRSFIQGLFVALGTTVGLSIVLGIVTYIIHTLKLVPGVNNVIDKTNIEEVLPEDNELLN